MKQMIKIKGKKLPPEETYEEHKLVPDGNKVWYCSSHQMIFEAGDLVFKDGKGELKCPLDGCKMHGLTHADLSYFEENYILDK